MVTTLKNSSVTIWAWSGAGFVRESASERQLDRPNRLQLYKRARYYDPSTGEFVSRDPLEYVDGMSLYRGYFVPKAMDPTGRSVGITKTECEKAKEQAKIKYGATLEKLDSEGCPRPEMLCVNCRILPIINRPLGPKKAGGVFNPEDNTIIVCHNRQSDFESAVDVWGHEFIHALDVCSGADAKSCSDRICTEIRAYSFCNCGAGSPRRRGRTREECIKTGARASGSKGSCVELGPDGIDDLIDLLYPKCAVNETATHRCHNEPSLSPPDWPLETGNPMTEECFRR